MQLCSAMTKSPPGMAAEASWEAGRCSGLPCRQLGSCNPERRTTICIWHSRKLEPARAPLGRWAPLPFTVLTPPQVSARREVCWERTWPVTLWAAPIPASPRKPFHAWIQLPRIVLVCRRLGGVPVFEKVTQVWVSSRSPSHPECTSRRVSAGSFDLTWLQ